mgnify:FL=1
MAFDREKAAAGVMLFGPLGAVLGESKDSKHNDGGKTSYIAREIKSLCK